MANTRRALTRLAPVIVGTVGLVILLLAAQSFVASGGFAYDYEAYDLAARRIAAGTPLYPPGLAEAYNSADYAGLYLYPPPLAIALVPMTVLDARSGRHRVARAADRAARPRRRDPAGLGARTRVRARGRRDLVPGLVRPQPRQPQRDPVRPVGGRLAVPGPARRIDRARRGGRAPLSVRARARRRGCSRVAGAPPPGRSRRAS